VVTARAAILKQKNLKGITEKEELEKVQFFKFYSLRIVASLYYAFEV